MELIVTPASDVDRAKEFYQEAVGFRLDVEHRAATYEEALGFDPVGRRSRFRFNARGSERQLEGTFATLRRCQNDKGAFGYWSAETGEGTDFISVLCRAFSD